MSHFSTVKTQFENQDALVKALQSLGFEPKVNQKRKRLKGGGAARYAEIIVSGQEIGTCYQEDLGFEWDEEAKEYKMHVSPYDLQRGNCAPGQGLGTEFLARLTLEYQANVIEADGQFTITQKICEPNNYRLEVEPVSQLYVGMSAMSTSAPGW